MVQESWIDTICITEKLKPRSAIKGTLRGVRGGVKSPYSITQDMAHHQEFWSLMSQLGEDGKSKTSLQSWT